MQLPSELTPEAHAALVECLRIAARRGQALRKEREAKAAKKAEEKDDAETNPKADGNL